MKLEGFVATRKQFDYKFRNWGLREYGQAKSVGRQSTKPSSLHNSLAHAVEGEAVAASNFNRKRPQSTQRIATSGSGLPFTLQPLSKKAKIADEDAILQSSHLDLLPAAYRSNSPTGHTFVRDAGGTVDNRHVLDRPKSPTVNGHHSSIFPSAAPEPPAMDDTGTIAEAFSTDAITSMIDSKECRELLQSAKSLEADSSVLVPQFDGHSTSRPPEDP
ncbi:hypothetical protein PG996_004422 [Apiospora saccharicola]|uniref:Clr5 domain-containing protein n=1 Tax=Apiospora saccharicola TaxID=335842 RepID=A0ABR1W495_9PEZI